MKDVKCPYCGKYFVFETYASWSYEAEKADCLNNGIHDFKLTHTIPKELSVMRCTMCDKERELTDQERTDFSIGTVKNYIESLKR